MSRYYNLTHDCVLFGEALLTRNAFITPAAGELLARPSSRSPCLVSPRLASHCLACSRETSAGAECRESLRFAAEVHATAHVC